MDGYFEKILYELYKTIDMFKKKSCIHTGSFIWVDDGARTHDPQNHNLML